MFRCFYIAVLGGSAFLLSGCDDSINPAAPFETRVVVYSVLNTLSDTQFVRLYTTYNPPHYDPSANKEEQTISDAGVTVSDGATSYSFQFTLIPRPDTSRYNTTLGLYSAFPFRPVANRQYTLNISTSFGVLTATTTIPGEGRISCFTINELQQPDRYAGALNPVTAEYILSDLTKARLVRFYVVYTTENPNEEGKEKYEEVPSFVRIIDKNYDIVQKIFPSPGRRTAPLTRRGQTFYNSMNYPFPAYNETLYQILRNNFNVRFKRAVFFLIQFDEAWYKHYATGNLFQDKLGVRLDPPDYTNIQGGWGLFGSFRVDSTVVELPEYIVPYPPQYGR